MMFGRPFPSICVFIVHISLHVNISSISKKTCSTPFSLCPAVSPPPQPVLSAEAGPIGMGVLEESAFASFCSFSGAQMLTYKYTDKQ